jgi:hypothetical protein
MCLIVTAAIAQNPPVPQVVRAVQEQKGEWEVEVIDGSQRGKRLRTVCAEDPVAAISYESRPSRCTKRLTKDTADEAVAETVCPQGMSRAVLTRDGRTLHMHLSNPGPNGQQVSRWRFTALGACRDGST